MKIDYTGQRFGRLVAVKEISPYVSPSGKKTRRYLCHCDCGNDVPVLLNSLTRKRNPTRSCGCIHSEKSRAQARDITGQRFGRLVVVKEISPYVSPSGKKIRRYLCHCDCGNDVPVLLNSLTCKRNPTRSCGCIRSEKSRASARDMTGQRIGRLVVLGPCDLLRPQYNGTRLGWLCRCDCGNEIVSTRKSLLSGKVLSCGCLLKETSAAEINKRVMRQDGTQLTAIRPGRPANKNSKSGIRGVYWSERDGCWIAKIGFKGRTITLGRFSRVEDAADARRKGEQKYFVPLLAQLLNKENHS